MQIKRFEAKDMTEALRLVKKEFGANAVILSAKTQKKTNRFLGTSKTAGVVITAATDQYAADQSAEHPEPAGKQNSAASAGRSADVKSNGIYNNYGLAMRTAATEDTAEKRVKMDNREGTITRVHTVPKIGVKKALSLFRGRLLSQGVESAVAKELVAEIESGLSDGSAPLALQMKNAFEEILASRSVIAAPVARNMKQRRGTHVMAIVGPSGMGKTATVVKLAIQHQVEMNHRVGVISLDHYRIGATSALQTYTKVADIPFEMASDAATLENALDALRDRDIVFIDTPGLGLKDLIGLDELAGLLDVAAPDEVHLALSTTVKDSDMLAYLRHFEPLRLNRLLFTKTDESSTHGNILNLLIKSELPLTYLTGGQRVPEDIEVADIGRLSELMLPKVEEVMENSLNALGLHREGGDEIPSVSVRARARYVANQNSDIFHHHQCKSVKRINEDNIIYFEDMEEAIDKKFKPCRMCCMPNRDARTASVQARRAAYGKY